jgi:hypothetical protein
MYPSLVVVVDPSNTAELSRHASGSALGGSESGFAPDLPSSMLQIINDGELEYVEKEYIRDR